MNRLVLAGLLLTPTLVPAAEWSRFRGPNGTGSVDDTAIPLKWSATENMAWKVEVPGIGHSSPIVANGKVYVQSASKDGSERMLHAFDATTGKLDWTRKIPGHTAHTHKKNSLASSTPAADSERVYAVVWDGEAVGCHAFDLQGKPLWAKVLGPYVSQHGVGFSPVLFGGNVYLNYDQDGAAEFVCLDAKTGEKKWAAKRTPFRACYSCPLVRELGNGKVEIVNASTAGLTGYDPDTGAVNWNWTWKFAGMALRTVGSPIVVGETVLAVSGDGGGSRSAVAVSVNGTPKLQWELTKQTPYVPGPVALGQHAYWITDDGFATCAEVKSGKIVWRERVVNSAVSASLVMVSGNIIAIDEAGNAVVFKATPAGLDKVAENEFKEAVFATPAVANGKLYVRGGTHLFCIAKKPG